MPLAADAHGPTLCIGEILVEIVAETVGDGFREPLSLRGPFPSGAPAIFVDQCGRLGGSAAMIGAVGDDDFGRINVERLAADGVDVTAIEVLDHLPTGTAFVRYRHDGTRDFVFSIAASAAGRLSWTANVEALAGRAGHLHVMGSALSMPCARDVIDRALAIVKRRGGSVSLDPNLRKELHDGETSARFARLLAETDLLLPSGEEILQVADADDEDDAVRHVFDLGVDEIVLKRGAAGATYFCSDGTRSDAPAFRIDEVDPTGAGDCFGGALVAALRLGESIDDALTYACAAGARNATRLGPMEGAGTREELDLFIDTTERAA